MKPLLRWVGGKYNQHKVIEILQGLWEPYRDTHLYVEPFAGGLGSALRLSPKRAIIADSNAELINFYWEIQNGFQWDPLWADLPAHDYLALRNLFNQYIAGNRNLGFDSHMTLFYLLNRLSHNGIWRVNKQGFYNVPPGKDSKGRRLRCEFVDLNPYRDLFTLWTTTHTPYKKLISWFADGEKDAFIYADPPYDGTFCQYTANPFTWEDQETLARVIAQGKNPGVISNSATPRILELYKGLGFEITLVDAKRSVSCDGNRVKVQEVVAAINCKIPAH
jgi:DNA adenine methylase